jgi:hypothetical protein
MPLFSILSHFLDLGHILIPLKIAKSASPVRFDVRGTLHLPLQFLTHHEAVLEICPFPFSYCQFCCWGELPEAKRGKAPVQ